MKSSERKNPLSFKISVTNGHETISWKVEPKKKKGVLF